MADEQTPDPELSGAVEDALDPAKHEAVMAVWQQVVLGRLEGGRAAREDDDLTRRIYERIEDDSPPDDSPPDDSPPDGSTPDGSPPDDEA